LNDGFWSWVDNENQHINNIFLAFCTAFYLTKINILGIVDGCFFGGFLMRIQEIRNEIKRVQANMKKLKQSHCHNKALTLYLYKQQICRLLQLEDDWQSIYYSQARYIPTRKKQ
jgi:hypothetical protein